MDSSFPITPSTGGVIFLFLKNRLPKNVLAGISTFVDLTDAATALENIHFSPVSLASSANVHFKDMTVSLDAVELVETDSEVTEGVWRIVYSVVNGEASIQGYVYITYQLFAGD